MREENLIFLVSLPRSGSTLLQRIIGAHSKVYTRSEPWIMFPSAYALKSTGVTAEYDFEASAMAIDDFATHLPDGKQGYIDAVKKMHLSLYGAYVSSHKKEYFLDKTPRYYLIYPELREIFPRAKQIILIRNPLAVLSSMLTTWIKQDYSVFKKLRIDLLEGIDLLLSMIGDRHREMFVVKYEDLLCSPDKTVDDICRFLGIAYEEGMLDYFLKHDKMLYGDPENVYKYQGVARQNDRKWQEHLSLAQHWRFINDYLVLIGEERFTALGYDYKDMESILRSYHHEEAGTVSLSDVLGSSLTTAGCDARS